MVVHAAIGRGRHYVSLPPPLPTSFLLQTLLPSPFVFVCVLCCRRRAPRSLQNAKRKSRIRRYFRKLDEPPLLPFARLTWRLLLLPSAAETRGRRKKEEGLLCVCTFFLPLVPQPLHRIGPCLNPVPFFCAARLTTEIPFFGMPCLPSVSRACAEQYK